MNRLYFGGEFLYGGAYVMLRCRRSLSGVRPKGWLFHTGHLIPVSVGCGMNITAHLGVWPGMNLPSHCRTLSQFAFIVPLG